MASPIHRRILLAGPTAVGKSEIALRLAEHLGGEIISVDSMQVYRGMDIGTAKPTPADRARVPHHLIDVVEPADHFDAAKFRKLAQQAVEAIEQRGRRPILCGGTGLYFNAWLHGLGDAPPADPHLRAELEAMAMEALLAELEQRDPESFSAIDRRNRRRVVRAVEVVRLTGRKYSAQRARWRTTPTMSPTGHRLVCFTRSRADLHDRLDARVEKMFRDGLVEETRGLLERGLERNPTAMQALGYRQVVEHLRGERGLAETVALVKLRTRQYAKRQLTWFRAQPESTWFELGPADDPGEISKRVREEL